MEIYAIYYKPVIITLKRLINEWNGLLLAQHIATMLSSIFQHKWLQSKSTFSALITF